MKKLTVFLISMVFLISALSSLHVSAVAHTFTNDFSVEQCEQIVEKSQGVYTLGENEIYYCTLEHPLLKLEPYDPNPGTVDFDDILQALARLHPEAKFAVSVTSCPKYPEYLDEEIRPFMDSNTVKNGMTYTECYKAYDSMFRSGISNDEEKKLYNELEIYVQEMRPVIQSYLKNEYIPALFKQNDEKLAEFGISSETHQGILTSEQILEFHGHEMFGYFLSLAPYSSKIPKQSNSLYGDANADGTVDIMDVVLLNKFILGCQSLDDFQRECADVNRDGAIEPDDALHILKYVVGNITDFDEICKQPDETQDTVKS